MRDSIAWIHPGFIADLLAEFADASEAVPLFQVFLAFDHR
jgi:hypothetical protein